MNKFTQLVPIVQANLKHEKNNQYIKQTSSKVEELLKLYNVNKIKDLPKEILKDI